MSEKESESENKVRSAIRISELQKQIKDQAKKIKILKKYIEDLSNNLNITNKKLDSLLNVNDSENNESENNS